MATLIDHFFLQAPQVYTLLATILYVLSGAAIGRAIGRPLLEGALLGFLVLIAAGDLSLYISRPFLMPLWAFNAMFCVGVMILTVLLHHFPFAPAKNEPLKDAPGGMWVTVFTVSVFALVTWGTNILTAEPAAGFTGFQAMNPLYIDGARLEGRFLTHETWRMGHGIIGANTLYAADTLGLAAAASLLLGLPAHSAYAGSSIAATMLSFAALSGVLQRHPIAQIVFLGLGLTFFRFGGSFRTFLGDNWSDAAIYAAAALTLAFVGRGGRIREAAPAVVLAAAFMVFGRNYGIFYAFVLGIAGFIATRVYGRQWCLWRWMAVGVLSTIFAFRELIAVARYGLFYPKPHHSNNLMPLAERFWAILGDTGVMVERYVFDLPIPALLPSLLVLAVVAYQWRSRKSFHGYRWFVALAPLSLIAIAVFLELLSGFRVQTGSKLYVVCLFVAPWYPAFLISMMGIDRRLHELWVRRRRSITFAAALVSVSILVAGAYIASERRIGQMGLAKYVEFAFESYRQENHDLQIGKYIRRLPTDELADIQQRPVMLFHSEPGMGFRYFVGGDMRMDWDFWSRSVHQILSGAECLAQALQRLDSPNLYFSYPGWGVGNNVVPVGDGWRRFEKALSTVEENPWIKKIISYRYSKFYYVDSTILARTRCDQ